LPVEIKYRGRIQRRDLAGLKSFMGRHKAKKGYLISYDFEKNALSPGERYLSSLPGSFCSFTRFLGSFFGRRIENLGTFIPL